MCHGPVLSQVLIPIISESNREPMLARHSGWHQCSAPLDFGVFAFLPFKFKFSFTHPGNRR